ncbi:sulfatase-like hydrolase/transferase [Portibacter lacus]|nr:sulfatase-like hydrolase/transferase [Portibacter lacus]
MKYPFLFASIFFIIITLVIFQSCTPNNPSNSTPEKPNIVLIYADDLGKGLLSIEGQKIIKTPHIDQLAKDGMRFTNAYSAMFCAPARATLITGLHDLHADAFEIPGAGIYKRISTGEATLAEIDSTIKSVSTPIPDHQKFIGNIAKEAGYTTGQFGKLEWGFSATMDQMTRHGWDHYLGYLDHQRAHGFYPPFLFEDGKIRYFEGNTLANCGKSIERETDKAYQERWDMTGKATYSQDIFMDGVHKFLHDNKERPFFLYFPTQLPHGPVSIPEVHPDFVNNDSLTQIEKEYASMVKLLDDNVGEIIQTLRELDLTDNTIVIFTGDNGHEIYYAQEGRVVKPYTNMETGIRFDDLTDKYYSEIAGDVFDGNNGRAGMKRSNLQGGIEVPLIIKWPGKVKANSTSDRLVASYDFMSTLSDMVENKSLSETDGTSYYNTLIGKKEENDRGYLVYSSFQGPTLINSGGWKLRMYYPKNIFELYYLPDDFREENNLADQNPEIVSELKALLLEECEGDYINGFFTNAKNQIAYRR